MKRGKRAFTLLEIILATAMAGVVAIACFMLFASINSTNRRMAGRSDRNFEVERAHLAFQNAFVAIATSEKPRRRPNTNAAATPEGQQPDAGDKSDSSTPPPPARVILGPDAALTTTTAPRLEMTLARSPIGGATKRNASNIPEDFHADDTTARVNNSSDGGLQAIRGAFVVRPQSQAAGPDARAGSTELNQLWWVPLPPAVEEGQDPLPMSAAAGYPVLLASDVTRFNVRFYHDGEWKQDLSVTWEDELPAYAEVGLEFASGSQYRWLMEIDYVIMAEVTANGLDASGEDTKSGGGIRGRGNIKPSIDTSRAHTLSGSKAQ